MKTISKWTLGLTMMMGMVAGNALAGECTVRQVDGKDVTICAARSTAGKQMHLMFDGDKVTQATVSGVACSDPASVVTSAILWMPDHGHGSSPTSLEPRQDGCTVINDIDFTMLGTWQIRIRYRDGDRGVFEFPVVE